MNLDINWNDNRNNVSMENQQASRPPAKNLKTNVPVHNACNAWMHSIIHKEIAKQE